MMKTIKYSVVFLSLTFLLYACAPATLGLREEPIVVGVEAPAEEPLLSEDQVVEAEGELKSGEQAQVPGLSGDIDPLSLAPAGGRMVIKDGLIDLLVSDTDRAMGQVTQLTSDQGGYIISSRSWVEDGFKYAEFRLGIPSVAFESTLNILRDLGISVLDESITGQDVSAEYTDLQSSLTNLEATAARVRGFLDEAENVEESLRINQTLADLEGQIEQVKGQMRYYEGRSAYSTVSVTLTPQRPTPTPSPTSTPPPPWNPGETFKESSKVMVKIFQGTTDFLIWVLVLFWPLIILAIAALLIFRYRRAKRMEKKSSSE